MGKYFKIADEFYKVYVPFFKQLLNNQQIGTIIRKNNLSLQFFITDLKTQILVDCSTSDEKVICGNTNLEGDVKIWLKSDLIHHLWLGKIELKNAIMAREIKVQGQAEKLKEVTSVFKPAIILYKQFLLSLSNKDFLR